MGSRVLIIGGGFGGMACARALARSDAEVRLIDRRNFHLFQPLLYQVATGGLSPANIAAPLRSVFRKQRNCQVEMAEVTDFDPEGRRILLGDGEPLAYDQLVLAPGSCTHYFGRDQEWEPLAPGLKTVEDAMRIRRQVLSAFEAAERMENDEQRRAVLTFVIVGGGPTGVEMAGSICELAHQTMRRDFRQFDPAMARVILLEFAPGILSSFHAASSQAATRDLQAMAVEVWNGARLMEVHPDRVMVQRGEELLTILTRNVIWAAGVRASPLATRLAQALGQPELLDRAGRIRVDSGCAVPGREEIFVIGDSAAFEDPQGKGLPGIAPVALQQGRYVGQKIRDHLRGRKNEAPFRYFDKGNMATIGRSRAVVETGGMRFRGKLAWLIWLFVHILYLARFENRILVLFQWFWNYVTRNRAARLITR